jgi:hypothetical protein
MPWMNRGPQPSSRLPWLTARLDIPAAGEVVAQPLREYLQVEPQRLAIDIPQLQLLLGARVAVVIRPRQVQDSE